MLISARQCKPWPGVRIDVTNPLAQGLQFVVPFNEGSNTPPLELVNRVSPTVTAVGWGSNIDGAVGTFGGSGSLLSYPSPAFASLPGISILIRCSLASLASNYGLVQRNPYGSGWALATNVSGNLQWICQGSQTEFWPISGVSANVLHTFVMTYEQAASTLNLYADGIPVLSNGAAGGGTAGNAAGAIYIGQNLAGNVSLTLIANRAWTPQEVNQLSANPWQIFAPAWPRGLVIRQSPALSQRGQSEMRPASRLRSAVDPWLVRRQPRTRVFRAPVTVSVVERSLRAHYGLGLVTVHAVGVNTSWTSGTTFTVSGVSGWAVSSKTVVDGTHVTLVLSCPTVGGAVGTLTISDGIHSASIRVRRPRLRWFPGLDERRC